MARETEYNLQAVDGKTIYGKLIDFNSSSKPLVIFSHGLADHMDNREMFNAAWFLAGQGFSTYRFNYYDGREDARDITECTLETHAQDLDTIVGNFRQQRTAQICIIGHSFGALVILLSRQLFDKAVLWDPSHPKVSPFRGADYLPELKGYIIKWGVDYFIGQDMVHHFHELDIRKLVKAYKVPTLIISAGAGELIAVVSDYYDSDAIKKHIEIPKADHNFTVEGTYDKLLHNTLQMLMPCAPAFSPEQHKEVK